MCIFNKNNKLVEKQSYILFSSIKNHLYTKLKKLAVIKASIKKENDTRLFRYYELCLYNLKSFNTFIDLISHQTLKIDLISRISKSGADKGRYRNKNIVFSISKKDISKLFDCYYKISY